MLIQTAREKRIRRALAKDGYRLWKVREDNPRYWEYGPYGVIQTDRNWVILCGMDLDAVEHWMTG